MRRLIWAICSGASLCLCVGVRAAVGFSLSPAFITNDYEGTLNLTITGLTPGQSAGVRAYVDLNRNGAIDAGEPLVLQFTVTDGQVPLIGGVRNRNVPGDEDGATNGQILVKLPFPWVDHTGFPAAIKSVFQVFDPQGVFATTNQPFTVVQRIYPQGVRGHLTAVTTNGAALTNTLVGMGSATRLLPTSLYTETDTNGDFTIYAAPDTYVLGTLKDGFLNDLSQQVTVPCGQFVTNHATAASAGLTVSGRVSDSANGNGLGGVSVTANDTNGLFQGVALTGTNGNFSIPVLASNTWRLRVDQGMLSQAGYLALAKRSNVIVAGTSVSNINFSFAKATALVYGAITDDRGNPIIGAVLGGQESGAIVQREAYSAGFATNGGYSVGLTAGNWNVFQLPDELAEWGLTGAIATNVTLANGQALALNVVLTRTNFPSLAGPARDSPSQVHFALTGLAAVNYLIQFSTNLSVSNWFPLLVTNGGCAPVTITDTQATNAARYYRAFILP